MVEIKMEKGIPLFPSFPLAVTFVTGQEIGSFRALCLDEAGRSADHTGQQPRRALVGPPAPLEPLNIAASLQRQLPTTVRAGLIIVMVYR